MKVNINKTKMMMGGESRLLGGHVLSVVEVWAAIDIEHSMLKVV